MYQSTEVLGYVGKDAEMRYLKDGTPVVSFSVASSRSWRMDDEWSSETTWFRVSCFGTMYENKVPKLTKGSLVFVSGRLVPDSDTGGPKVYKERASYDLRCQTLKICVSKESEEIVADSGKDVVPF